MRLHRLFSLLIGLSALPAMAQDDNANAALCDRLYQRLGNAPQVIGNGEQVRAKAQSVTQQNIEIRKLRLDLRRHECGSGSITVLGGPNDAACRALRQMLSDMENNRQQLLSQRNQARSLVAAGRETDDIRADIAANGCAPPDSAPTPVSLDGAVVSQPEPKASLETLPTAPPQMAPPSGGTDSAVIRFNGTPRGTLSPAQEAQAPQAPPPPERDYDPSRPVRMVGPIFLPDSSDIDLAHPAGGSQQQQ